MTTPRPQALAQVLAISVDLDAPLDYSRFYRFGVEPPSDPFLGEALPHLLELFGELGIRATFFAIARDAGGTAASRWLRRAAEMGHEIANHSTEHPHAWSRLSRPDKAREIDQAAERLEQATGTRVVGFRCPAYDLDPETIELLLERGYLYDSSLVPSPFLVPMKWIVQWKARRRAVGLGRLSHAFSTRAPHFYSGSSVEAGRPRSSSRAPQGDRVLVELPLTVLPWLRFPFWGTITQIVGERGFGLAVAALRREGLPINYGLHAAEVAEMGSAAAAGGERVPGYGSAVSARQQRLRSTLAELTRGVRSLTLAELARETLAQARGPA